MTKSRFLKMERIAPVSNATMVPDIETVDFSRSSPLSMREQQKRARARGVHWDEGLGGWLVASFDNVRRVMSNPGRFASEGTPVAEAFGAQAMLVVDSPMHHKLRAAWADQMSAVGVENVAERIQDYIDQTFEPCFEALNRGEAVDLVSAFWRLTSRVISDLMNVPYESAGQFIELHYLLADNAVVPFEPTSPKFIERAEAKEAVFQFLRPLVQQRRAALARGEQLTDMISMMAATQGTNGITEQVVVDNLLNLYLGAFETTALWMGNITIRLYEDENLRELLRSDSSLIPAALEEMMRIDTVVQLNMRVVRVDTELDGVQLKAGDSIFVMQGAANQDPAAYEDPERFDINRTGKPHLGFGFGFHQCIGQFLARLEARLYVKHILANIPALTFEEKYFGTDWMVDGPKRLIVRKAVA